MIQKLQYGLQYNNIKGINDSSQKFAGMLGHLLYMGVSYISRSGIDSWIPHVFVGKWDFAVHRKTFWCTTATTATIFWSINYLSMTPTISCVLSFLYSYTLLAQMDSCMFMFSFTQESPLWGLLAFTYCTVQISI